MYMILYICCCSVAKSCLTLCDPMNYSTPGFSALHYLPEFAQTCVHWVSDAIQPSHPPSPLSPLALNFSQHQDLSNQSALHIRWPKYWSFSFSISSVQFLSHVWLFASPWTAACQASLSITNSWSLLKLMSIESVMPSSHLILCHPLLLQPPIPPRIRVFSNESTLCMRWPKYWSFSFNISPSNEHPGLVSFRMDWYGSPCSPRDSKESSPTPQFKSINSSVLSFLHSPTLTSIHDHWKNHSLD